MSDDIAPAGGNVSSKRYLEWFSCKTCRISKLIVLPVGIDSFRLRHFNHQIELGRLFPGETPFATAKTPEEPVKEPSVTSRLEGERVGSAEITVTTPLKVERISHPEKDKEIKDVVASPSEAVLGAGVQKESPSPPSQPNPPSSKQASLKTEVQKEAPAPRPRPEPPIESRAKEEHLFLAKFSYIQEGGEFREEARRVSSVLREFRWNVKPPYVISVITDDILAIKSQTGVISSRLVQRMESLGYNFVALEAPDGTPTVWFKRGSTGTGQKASQLEDLVAELKNTLSEQKRMIEKAKKSMELTREEEKESIEPPKRNKGSEGEYSYQNDAEAIGPEPDLST